jgi:hypothetical protein
MFVTTTCDWTHDELASHASAWRASRVRILSVGFAVSTVTVFDSDRYITRLPQRDPARRKGIGNRA